MYGASEFLFTNAFPVSWAKLIIDEEFDRFQRLICSD
jgi:hypothetical protein